jgi:hypothetical protein
MSKMSKTSRTRCTTIPCVASIRKERVIEARPDDVWAALRDWGAIHQRLAPGFVVDAQLDGDVRVVRFFNGSVLREQLVDLDDDARPLVWSIVGGPYSHHNGSAQVLSDSHGRARFVWVATCSPTSSPSARPS